MSLLFVITITLLKKIDMKHVHAMLAMVFLKYPWTLIILQLLLFKKMNYRIIDYRIHFSNISEPEAVSKMKKR